MKQIQRSFNRLLANNYLLMNHPGKSVFAEGLTFRMIPRRKAKLVITSLVSRRQ